MRPKFSIHDPAFQNDAELRKLRPRFIMWIVIFCFSIVVNPLVLGFLFDSRKQFDPQTFWILVTVIGSILLIAIIGFVYHAVMVNIKLNAYYQKQLGRFGPK